MTVVNAARVSFDKTSTAIAEGDVKLIKYLAGHNHWTPFAHSRFTFTVPMGELIRVPPETELRQGLVFTSDLKKVRHSFFGWVQLLKAGHVNPVYEGSLTDYLIWKMPVSSEAYGLKADLEIRSTLDVSVPNHETDPRFIDHTLRETVPIFVARQRFKHTVDFEYNEVSRRYVSDAPDFFTPDAWRGAPTNGAKQGSSDDLGSVAQKSLDRQLTAFHAECVKRYEMLLFDGVAPEQARMVLPQSMMTSYFVTGSLVAWRRAYGLRIDGHAQKEIRDLAVIWSDLIKGVA